MTKETRPAVLISRAVYLKISSAQLKVSYCIYIRNLSRIKAISKSQIGANNKFDVSYV